MQEVFIYLKLAVASPSQLRSIGDLVRDNLAHLGTTISIATQTLAVEEIAETADAYIWLESSFDRPDRVHLANGTTFLTEEQLDVLRYHGVCDRFDGSIPTDLTSLEGQCPQDMTLMLPHDRLEDGARLAVTQAHFVVCPNEKFVAVNRHTAGASFRVRLRLRSAILEAQGLPVNRLEQPVPEEAELPEAIV